MAFSRGRSSFHVAFVSIGVLMIVVVVQADVVIPNLGTVTGKIVDFKEDNFIGVDTEIHAFLVRWLLWKIAPA